MRETWSVLRYRDFRMVWGATVLSDLAIWMQIATLGVFVTQAEGNARWTGLAATVFYLAGGLFLQMGGVFADQYDRRKLIIAACLFQFFGGLALASLFLLGFHAPIVLIAVAGLQSIGSSFSLAGLTAFVADLVSKERMPQAVLLEALSWNVGRAIGPSLALFLVAKSDYSAVFGLNALAMLGLGAALFFVRTRPQRVKMPGSLWARLRDGYSEMRTNVIVRFTTLFAIAEMALVAPFIGLIPAMGLLVLGAETEGTSMLYFGQGLGAALGVVFAGNLLRRFGMGKACLGSLFALPFLLLLYAQSGNLLLATLCIVPLSAAHAVASSMGVAFSLKFAPEEVRGRVSGLHRSLISVTVAIAASLAGPLSDHIGLREVLTLGALMMLGVVLMVALVRSRSFRTVLATR